MKKQIDKKAEELRWQIKKILIGYLTLDGKVREIEALIQKEKNEV